ncbi:pentapeptide repeat-containing protein [Rhizobiales bacterium]|uniref:pentapeptide repeat-containing protein n=1 Tax=Hongsoonwoonella zoysiae TaxID=2821844 RepID=UPI00156149D3|nr:pentapeptide repeat-containing protein [Hongsoonwoonella zoysiae]NRG16778.1 pentapeptide repeat-containing protein [Hongsoonwoonella zoysiae]
MATQAASGGSIPDKDVAVFEKIELENVKLKEINGKRIQHAFLTDVSGKSVDYVDVDFSYSLITRGYFHNACFKNCKFVGCHFINCNFRNASFVGCDFRYSDFTGTRISTNELLNNLPDEPNVRREFLQILRKNSMSLGDVSSARKFILKEIDARKEHLRRAWRQDESYYKKKYSGFGNQMKIGLQRVALWFDSFLWGHGERLWRLAFSTIVLLGLAALISTINLVYNHSDATISFVSKTYLEYLYYYLSLFLDVDFILPASRIILLEWIVVVTRYVAFGVLVTGLFRWLSHR